MSKRTGICRDSEQMEGGQRPLYAKPLEVDAVMCERCRHTIWSEFRHDFKYCKCGDIFIDGGREYTRIGYMPGKKFRYITLRFDVYGRLDFMQLKEYR